MHQLRTPLGEQLGPWFPPPGLITSCDTFGHAVQCHRSQYMRDRGHVGCESSANEWKLIAHGDHLYETLPCRRGHLLTPRRELVSSK